VEAAKMLVRIRHPEKLVYPESDGQPMGENTLQFQWIITLFHGFESFYFDRPDVFVAGDLFWYPVKGDPTTVQAPDLMIVFGRPKGHRGSYKQWDEGGVAPQVAIEIQSPGNAAKDLTEKHAFYSEYGVEEYYLYDPLSENLLAWLRSGRDLVPVANPNGFVSPLLGVTFEIPDEGSLRVIRPDGRRFLTYAEMIMAAEEQQRLAAEERARAAKLAAKLRELGVDPDSV
jgi:Uma2 family endonuclease